MFRLTKVLAKDKDGIVRDHPKEVVYSKEYISKAMNADALILSREQDNNRDRTHRINIRCDWANHRRRPLCYGGPGKSGACQIVAQRAKAEEHNSPLFA